MAAPTLIGTANSGTVITATSGTVVNDSGGNLTTAHTLIVAITQDGTGATATLSSISSSISDLAGTTAAMTAFTGNPYAIGTTPDAKLLCFIGRVNTTIANAATLFTANSSGGDDLYLQVYFFSNVASGSTLSAVLENGSAGTINSAADTGTTISDVGVTTLGADRLACNIIGVNDDNALVSFTGETGGDWTVAANFGSATGTDGEIGIQTAAMATAATIDGGTYTQASDPWGVVGFALIGTTASTPTSLLLPNPNVVIRR